MTQERSVPERVVASMVYAAARHQIDSTIPFQKQVSEAETAAHENCIDHNVDDSCMTSPGQERPKIEWMIRTMMARGPVNFRVEWCDHCGNLCVICPLCGNNSCNAGYGLDGKCPVCPICYDLTESIYGQSVNKYQFGEAKNPDPEKS